MDPPRCKGSRTLNDPRIAAIPDSHGHAKGEHKPYAEERPIAYSARMLFLWFYHACRRGSPRFLMVSDHINYLTFEDPGAVHTVRRALKLAEAGDLHGAAETAGVEVAHAAVVSQGLRRGMRFSIGAELDNDPRSRPDAQNIVDAMRPDGMIRSVHFLTIEHPEKGPDFAWPFDNPEFRELYDVVGTERVWELYVAKLLDDVEKLPGHIVGHFYVPAIFGHWPEAAKLEQYEDQLLNVCFDRGMAIEINTRVFYRDNPQEIKDAFRHAYLRLMRKAKEKGVPIAIGADAHSPKDQGGAFDVVLQMLDEAEINEIVFPVAGRLARVALRATKEHLEKLKQQEPVAVQPGSSISGLGRAELGLPEREEIEEKVGAAADKLGHDESPKKRAASPARGSKRAPKRSVSDIHEGPDPEVATPETIAEAQAGPQAAEPAPPKPAPKKAAAKGKKAEPKVEVPVPAPVAKAAAPVAKAATKAAASATKAIKAVAKTAKAAVTAVTAKKAPATKAAKPASKSAAKSVKTKTAAKKTTAAKAPAKKAAPAAKKTAPKKATPSKKAPAKKAAAKKTPARKAAPAKRPAAAKKTTKPAAKKATSKKSTAKKQTRRR